MPQNSLTLCIDDTGVYYRVPICLINDPIGFDADFQTQKLKSKQAPGEKQMKLRFRNAGTGDHNVECSNHLEISALKKLYLEQLKDTDLTVEMLRMFAMGKELKDDLFVYSYDMIDELTI